MAGFIVNMLEIEEESRANSEKRFQDVGQSQNENFIVTFISMFYL